MERGREESTAENRPPFVDGPLAFCGATLLWARDSDIEDDPWHDSES
jgi:hypothetical protein